MPRLAEGEVGELVLDRTPFYAESGGQAADAGTIVFDGGRLEVLDVQRPIKGLVVHQVRVLEGELDAGREVHARVDPEWRTGARQAHSGTHVVHAALREVLGPTALQSGSYNRPGYLRLDFGWTQALTPEQVRDVETVSQQALRADLAVAWDYMTLEQAKEWGAIALFGETYDNTKVRVVEIGGPWSRELCGGTHVDHSSQIGTVVVTGETSVGSGNRRIEALTGVEGFGYLARERDVVAQLTGLLKTQPDDLVSRVQGLTERLKNAEKELEKARLAQLLGASADLAAGATQVGPVRLVAHRADGAGGGDVRNLAMDVRGRLPQGEPGVVVIIGQADGKVSVVAATNDEARARGLSAGELVRAVGPLLGGKGGGKDDVAQGGGTDASRIDEALALVAREVAARRRPERAVRGAARHRPGGRPDRGGEQRPLRLPGDARRDGARAARATYAGSRSSSPSSRPSRSSSACPARSTARRAPRPTRRATSPAGSRAELHPSLSDCVMNA